MPFAVIQTGGKQHRVEPGQTIEVERLPFEEGQTVELGEVLLISDENGLQQGAPLVEGAKVVGRVVKQTRGPKLIVFKYKPKTRYRRKKGHRQQVTRIAIDQIVTAQAEAPAEKPKRTRKVTEPAEDAKPKRSRKKTQETEQTDGS